MLAASSAAWSPAALAQPAPPPPAHDNYKVHMENGIKLFQDKNYGAALIEFKAAYEAHPKANPLLNIALCYKAQFNYPKAIQNLEKALKEHPDSMDANDKRAAEDAIKEMRGLLGYVTVRVTPTAGTIIVDGEDAAPGNASTQVPLGPGTHKVGARLDGFDPQEADVTVASGSRDKVVAITLLPNKGWLVVQYPGMLIGMDGKFLARDQFQGMIQPGQHVLQIYTPGRPGYPVTIQVNAGQSVYVKPGPRGAPLIRGGAQQAAQPVAPPPPPKKGEKTDPPAPVEPEVPVPQKKGFYIIGGVNIVWPLTHADNVGNVKNGYDANSGWSGEILGGYRVNNAAGFQLLFDYTNVFTPATERASGAGYTESTFYLGGGVRLMTLGKTVRLVGDLDGGVAIDTLTFSSSLRDDGRDNASGTNAQAFLRADGGLEIDLNGVLLDGCGQLGIQTTRGTGAPGTGFSSPLATFGLGLRVGYAFWK